MKQSGGMGNGSQERNKLVRASHGSDSGTNKPLKNLNGQVCQICGDTVGFTTTGDVFVDCQECGFPLCHNCYEYELKNGNESCPKCKTRYKSHKEIPQLEGDDDDDDVDNPENETSYGQGNTKARLQWEEEADLSSSSGHDSQQPKSHVTNGQLMSGKIAGATHKNQSLRPTCSPLDPSGRVHSLPYVDPKQPGLESDEEIRRVPEIGGEFAGTSAARPDTGSTVAPESVHGTRDGKRKRGRNPADKESKRLKRLLRNRVSAQQARERKKAYLNDLETKVKDLEVKNSELKERLSTLQNENQMLRQILKNTTASRRGSNSGANAE
ncbi:hypothetical protein Lal_00008032 [Lupinus albus]|uniref:Transcription factor HY5 n=1 Tax=Lupinus albus TaxID=3870 RepID=A0A6A4NXY1_LUPAL|nr:putative cellulose synthase (UDP-forming) transcription factor C2H2 family [Lupinus albus]KAF1891604.1 hypothetical protein Lal_00008032 [Lupinus albus]